VESFTEVLPIVPLAPVLYALLQPEYPLQGALTIDEGQLFQFEEGIVFFRVVRRINIPSGKFIPQRLIAK
jgi:hypothetical protein